MARQRGTNYESLRSTYDLAFGQLATEIHHLQTRHGVEIGSLAEAEQQLAEAYRFYLQTRNALADFLMARHAQDTPVTSQPPATRNEQPSASIQERAYFLWVDAGRPSGNDQANWYRAEARHS